MCPLPPDQLREALDAAFPRAWREILERPRDLDARFPAVYRRLRDFYRQDPAAPRGA